MASTVEICNRALQKLGARRITSIGEDSVNARACAAAYDALRQAELRAHPWSFSVARASLAEDSVAPEFGKTRSFTVPTDCLRVLPPYPEANWNSLDWQIEGKKIYTDDGAPLQIRYASDVTDPNAMDPLFREALACRLGLELCEELTQSNSKKESIRADYTAALREARRINAIEKIAEVPPEDTWVTVRR